VGLVAIGFLWAWVAQKSYGLLITGCILAGIAVGILLESSWGWNGAFLISLGIGFVMIDRLETRQNKWPLYVGGILAVLGVLIGILETGFLGSFWFALLLIAGGVFLLTRSGNSDNTAGWVKVEPQPSTPPSSYSASPMTTTPVTTTTTSMPEAPVTETRDVSSSFTSDTAEVQSATDTTGDVSIIAPGGEPITTPDVTPDVTLPLEYDQALYTRLETWRRETARTEDRAAYLILTNDTMQKIAATKPQTMEELSEIKGIGEVKLERYGEAILRLVRGES
jgi:hypothetical protein